MRPFTAVLGASVALAAVFAASLFFGRRRNGDVIPTKPKARAEQPVAASVREKIANFAVGHPKLAESEYKSFIASNEGSKDPKVQDEVGKARIGVAYIQAGEKDFKDARATLQEAAAEYRGTGEISPDFGGVKDEAAYQAAVCLVAENKKSQAQQAFVAFLKNYPESPLAKAAQRRLIRLNGGKDLPEYDRLVQRDITAQEKKAKFEMATCGPRALAYLLTSLRKLGDWSGVDRSNGNPEDADGEERNTPARRSAAGRRGSLAQRRHDIRQKEQNIWESTQDMPPTYEELAKLCGTTDQGTTLEGMRKALKYFGIESFGYELNLDDFKRAATPAVLLNDGHYVVLTKIAPGWIEIYDPISREGNLRVLALPQKDDGTFRATMLALSPVPVSGDEEDPAAPQEAHGLAGAEANRKDAAKRQKQETQQRKAAEKEWAKIRAPQGSKSSAGAHAPQGSKRKNGSYDSNGPEVFEGFGLSSWCGV